MFCFKYIVFVYLPFPRTLKGSQVRLTDSTAGYILLRLHQLQSPCWKKKNKPGLQQTLRYFFLLIDIIEDWPHTTLSSTWMHAQRLNGPIHRLAFAKLTYKSLNILRYSQNINASIWIIASQGLFVFPSQNLSCVCVFFITVVMNIMSEANWLLDGAESWTHPRHWGLWIVWEFLTSDIPSYAKWLVAFELLIVIMMTSDISIHIRKRAWKDG